jgi:prepilin-type N-terminal cleavage/methylation domain-containing protein
MSKRSEPRRSSGLTMIELLVVVAICAVLLGLGVPSLRSWLVSQRVISTTGEIVTDLRFARSEAISSNSTIVVVFNNGVGNGCYTVFRSPDPSVSSPPCDCSNGAGFACVAPTPYTELKTFALPSGGDVSMIGPTHELYKPGSMLVKEVDAGVEVRVIAAAGKELKVVTTAGLPHPTACAPIGSKITGYKPCP